jgi:hypothetical protein
LLSLFCLNFSHGGVNGGEAGFPDFLDFLMEVRPDFLALFKNYRKLNKKSKFFSTESKQ